MFLIHFWMKFVKIGQVIVSLQKLNWIHRALYALIIWLISGCRNVLKQLGKTTETLATLCVYPWHCINGFEVSKFPALTVSPAATEPPCRKLSWAALHDLNKNWAKPAKCGDFLLTSQLNSRTAWGRLAEALISFLKYCERYYSAKIKLNQFFTTFQTVLTSPSFWKVCTLHLWSRRNLY